MLLAVLALSSGQVQAQMGGVLLSSDAGSASVYPDRYIIQEGDTLWDISTAFMGDPYYWPQLWSLNEYITNPHWIYPGNEIVFSLGSDLEPPSMSFGGGEPDGYTAPAPTEDSESVVCGPDVHFQDSYASTTYSSSVFLADPADVETWGTLSGAKTGNTVLGEGDIVYLNLDDPDAVACGDLVGVFVQGAEVRHPDSRRVRYGNLWEERAILRIVHIDEQDRVTAVIRDSYGIVHRGDLIGPAFPVDSQFPVDEPKGDLDGTIIARSGQDSYRLASVGETVFIDRGKDDGLREGNSFYIVHQRDLVDSMFEDQDDVPEQVVGRIVLTHVGDATSTAVVVDASSPVRVGDQVTTLLE